MAQRVQLGLNHVITWRVPVGETVKLCQMVAVGGDRKEATRG